MPPNFSGIMMAVSPSAADFLHDGARDSRLVMLDGFEIRLDLFRPELIHRAGDGEMFFAQVLHREDFRGGAFLDQKRAAAGDGKHAQLQLP